MSVSDCIALFYSAHAIILLNNAFNNKLIIQQFSSFVNGEKMKTKSKIFIAFILNLLFSIFELFGGFITGSVAIASDAIHDFGDAASIGFAYFFEKIGDRKPDHKYTYGYARFSLLGGFLTTFILLLSSGIVIYNAILRIITPIDINYSGMMLFAVVGLTVNLIAAYFTHGGSSMNQKAVNLHMLEDVLGWLVVLVGAIVMQFTNLSIIDPILSIAVALFIIIHSIKNLMQIIDIFLMKTPKDIDINELIEHLTHIEGVVEAHHIHVWTIDGETHCATLHIVCERMDEQVKAKVKEELKEHGIAHTTVEMETCLECCEEKVCAIKKQEHHYHHHHH